LPKASVLETSVKTSKDNQHFPMLEHLGRI